MGTRVYAGNEPLTFAETAPPQGGRGCSPQDRLTHEADMAEALDIATSKRTALTLKYFEQCHRGRRSTDFPIRFRSVDDLK